ncbi:hypothetical protein DM02DRAFT_669703 [Periconia macrospinosa]|uniref:2EXR domain-containing protein n=1 Tax=Periconia macrospinosa TaxID=97972 RepID=A0A2V1E028_9PLEO|nr:hypothetical protein DM02DRAFT_669703 [Periconia macrospinosa]
MATFHPFPRLPLELRMQIWSLAFQDDRVLKVRKRRYLSRRDYWSPSPIPAVTRASRESRKHCSYQKAFIADGSSCYIWCKFDSDIIHMRMSELAHEDGLEKKEIRRLRIVLVDDMELEFFYHKFSFEVSCFPKLDGIDVLVPDGLYNWGTFIQEMYWGTCPETNVRMVDANSGEWIDSKTGGPYLDWIDTGRSTGGETKDYMRIDNDWDEEDEEAVAERYSAMMKMQEPLPRIDLNY